jgi:hypothetical protein
MRTKKMLWNCNCRHSISDFRTSATLSWIQIQICWERKLFAKVDQIIILDAGPEPNLYSILFLDPDPPQLTYTNRSPFPNLAESCGSKEVRNFFKSAHHNRFVCVQYGGLNCIYPLLFVCNGAVKFLFV